MMYWCAGCTGGHVNDKIGATGPCACMRNEEEGGNSVLSGLECHLYIMLTVLLGLNMFIFSV